MRATLTHYLLTFGPFGILFVSLLDSLAIPLPAGVDALVLTIAVKDPGRAWFAASMAVLGSTIGNLALFHAARHGSRILIKGAEPAGRRRKFRDWFARYGLLTIFVPCVTPIIPFPLKVFVVSAGALRTPTAKFLLVVLAARSLRFFGEAYLGLHLGEHAEEFLRRNSWTLLAAALTVALAGGLLVRRYNKS